MDVDLNKWFKCEVDKREFKKFVKNLIGKVLST